MLLLITKKATAQEIEQAAQDIGGFYIKIVVDIEKAVLAMGGERHVDAEQLLLEHGSNQDDLWGGGLDLKTKDIDYNSMINLRPHQENASRDVLSVEIRKKFDAIIKQLLL
ncbi:MAG TPA: DUF5674 family protein [Candidatus Saccharimonadales bacterium]|nr:DUF5674 family protein [Candidatus Saccharimonadales bacterium]